MEISNAHITLAAAADVAADAAAAAVVVAVVVAVAVAVAFAAKWQEATLTHFHDTQMSKIIAVKYANVNIFPTCSWKIGK